MVQIKHKRTDEILMKFDKIIPLNIGDRFSIEGVYYQVCHIYMLDSGIIEIYVLPI